MSSSHFQRRYRPHYDLLGMLDERASELIGKSSLCAFNSLIFREQTGRKADGRARARHSAGKLCSFRFRSHSIFGENRTRQMYLTAQSRPNSRVAAKPLMHLGGTLASPRRSEYSILASSEKTELFFKTCFDLPQR